MASEFVGVIVGTISGQAYAVINPDFDWELDNPRFLLMQNSNREPLRLAKVPRGEYDMSKSMIEMANLAKGR